MVDLFLLGNFIFFFILVVGFFEELLLGFLMIEGEGLVFLVGVLVLGGVFLGRGLVFFRWVVGILGVGLDFFCFIGVVFFDDLVGVFFCNL